MLIIIMEFFTARRICNINMANFRFVLLYMFKLTIPQYIITFLITSMMDTAGSFVPIHNTEIELHIGTCTIHVLRTKLHIIMFIM